MKLRPHSAGQTRACPHCGTTILRSEKACPACHRYLRHEAVKSGPPPAPRLCPLTIDGTIRHPGSEEPWEYTVMVQVRDDQGRMISNQVMGVGALFPSEVRVFTLRVECLSSGRLASSRRTAR